MTETTKINEILKMEFCCNSYQIDYIISNVKAELGYEGE